MWAQIGNERIDTIIPDGRTAISIYVGFSFSGETVPEGTPVKFLVGKLPASGLSNITEDGGEVVIQKWTETLVSSMVTAIPGVELVEYNGVIRNTLVRDQNNNFSIRPVAKAILKPIANEEIDSISIVAYSQYDKLGTITTRLTPDFITLPVTKAGGGVFLSVNERYDIVGNIWEEKTPMTVGRSGPVMEAVGGKLYAIGGFAGRYLDVVEEYDPATDTWTTKSPLPVSRAFASSVVYGGEIYVFGGSNIGPNFATDSTYKYDPIGDTWTELTTMPDAVTFGTAQVVGTKAYVAFGASRVRVAATQQVPGSTASNTTSETIDKFNFGVYSYDFSLDEWAIEKITVASPPTAALNADSATDKRILSVGSGALLPPYGVIVINNGGGNEEMALYDTYDNNSGLVYLRSGLLNDHFSGETIEVRSIQHNRVFPNSNVQSGIIEIFNGLQWDGYVGSSGNSEFFGEIYELDPSSGTYTATGVTPTRQRARAGSATDGTKRFIVGGSDEISNWQNKVEKLEAGAFDGPTGYDKMKYSRHSLGSAYLAGYVYAIGGGGSGHAPGWLKLEMQALPDRIKADGRENSSITVSAVDDAGDPPEDGVEVEFRGVVFIKKAKAELPVDTSNEAIQSSTGAGQPDPTPAISILPVLFSSKRISMINGSASTVLLPRSEDPIKEVEELSNFASTENDAQEITVENKNEDDLFVEFPRSEELYSIATEASILDDFYFGTSDTTQLIGQTVAAESSNQQVRDAYAAPAQTSISNPPSAKQGLSAKTDFYSDIVSMPDVTVMNTDPVDSTEAEQLLDDIRDEIPFGASPHYDAIDKGIDLRVGKNLPSPVINPQNIMLTVSDNDESYSEAGPSDIVDSANDIAGIFGFPIFINSFVVTEPVSLAARRARTDVADLEEISDGTGGSSFSIVDSSYVTYVIDRIKTSAPASIGSGTITGTHEIDGFLSFVSFTVSNMVPGNSAKMNIEYSEDGYNYESLGVDIQPNIIYSVGTPIKASIVKYIVRLESKTFDSPVLESVLLRYAEPNIQYLFTLPKEISGQVAELASVVNHRLPDGGYVEVGYAHGDTFMFDRDYVSKEQPGITGRGTSVAINRSFDTLLDDGTTTQDILKTSNFLVYKSNSGGWAYDSILRVFVNDQETSPQEYVSIPEEGAICFKKRLLPTDKVSVEITLPQKFRVGLKIVNPSTSSTGLLDSFAYMWGTTNDSPGYLLNRPPRAVNLFITPNPIVKGGPMVANYTFVDPDGDEEDTTQTQITWFRNGVPVPELANKKTVRNSDFRARRADEGLMAFGIAKGQEWFFTVRPSDGTAFGSVYSSPKIKVADTPPSLQNIRLVSSNEDPGLFTSSDTVRAKYDFKDVDGEAESGSIYTWFVNGLEVKSGKEAFIGPEEEANGRKILTAGATVRAEIIPSTGDGFGDPVMSDTATIQASVPSVEDVIITPPNPTSISILRLTYTFVDSDNLTDSSSVAWFKNGKKVSNLDNQKQVVAALLSPGQEWYAVITPNNGLVKGTEVKSNTVFIEF